MLIEFTASDGVLTSNKASLIFPGWKIGEIDIGENDGGVQDGDDVVATAALPFNGNMHFQVDQDRAVSGPANGGLLTPARDADDPSATSDNGPDPSDTDDDGPTKPGDLTIDPDLIEAPRNGNVAVNGDGSFTYTPYSGFTGRDWFTYRTDDGNAQGDYASAFVDVQPVPQAAVTLTVGAYSDPALPGLKQDTPFVPVDDGYFSATEI